MSLLRSTCIPGRQRMSSREMDPTPQAELLKPAMHRYKSISTFCLHQGPVTTVEPDLIATEMLAFCSKSSKNQN